MSSLNISAILYDYQLKFSISSNCYLEFLTFVTLNITKFTVQDAYICIECLRLLADSDIIIQEYLLRNSLNSVIKHILNNDFSQTNISERTEFIIFVISKYNLSRNNNYFCNIINKSYFYRRCNLHLKTYLLNKDISEVLHYETELLRNLAIMIKYSLHHFLEESIVNKANFSEKELIINYECSDDDYEEESIENNTIQEDYTLNKPFSKQSIYKVNDFEVILFRTVFSLIAYSYDYIINNKPIDKNTFENNFATNNPYLAMWYLKTYTNCKNKYLENNKQYNIMFQIYCILIEFMLPKYVNIMNSQFRNMLLNKYIDFEIQVYFTHDVINKPSLKTYLFTNDNIVEYISKIMSTFEELEYITGPFSETNETDLYILMIKFNYNNVVKTLYNDNPKHKQLTQKCTTEEYYFDYNLFKEAQDIGKLNILDITDSLKKYDSKMFIYVKETLMKYL